MSTTFKDGICKSQQVTVTAQNSPVKKSLPNFIRNELWHGVALPAEQSAGNSSSSSLSVSEMSIIEEEAVLELVWITPNKHFVGMSSINEDI
jgi:hypothetical protein